MILQNTLKETFQPSNGFESVTRDKEKVYGESPNSKNQEKETEVDFGLNDDDQFQKAPPATIEKQNLPITTVFLLTNLLMMIYLTVQTCTKIVLT